MAQLVKNPPTMWETWFDPWVGKIPWRWKDYLLQCSCLEKSMDWIVHEVAKKSDMTERLSPSLPSLNY